MKSGEKAAELIHRDGFDVHVTRKRVKNINLRIRPDGSVAVSAPARVPLREIARFVDAKDAWIRGHLERRHRTSPAQELSFRDGDTICVWGRPYPIVISEVATAEECGARLVGERFEIRAITVGIDDLDQSVRTRLVRSWQAGELKHAIEKALPDCEARVGKRASRITIKEMSSRWGSCNVRTGSISINLELVERDPSCLESVLIHELCHLWEANHGPAFYAQMDRAMPGWPEARALLKAAPPRKRAR